MTKSINPVPIVDLTDDISDSGQYNKKTPYTYTGLVHPTKKSTTLKRSFDGSSEDADLEVFRSEKREKISSPSKSQSYHFSPISVKKQHPKEEEEEHDRFRVVPLEEEEEKVIDYKIIDQELNQVDEKSNYEMMSDDDDDEEEKEDEKYIIINNNNNDNNNQLVIIQSTNQSLLSPSTSYNEQLSFDSGSSEYGGDIEDGFSDLEGLSDTEVQESSPAGGLESIQPEKTNQDLLVTRSGGAAVSDIRNLYSTILCFIFNSKSYLTKRSPTSSTTSSSSETSTSTSSFSHPNELLVEDANLDDSILLQCFITLFIFILFHVLD
ncbi:hypothetical protein PPL_00935 [Heterostelium album PN500]|uniref:Uncharacterized protein n=1 Tax=Heterostelium pallidum (strain ATCC 26659 / Pp 5 / PN500) TaxID=670386 RepID=D3AXM9_HETP5|nr:hypothetical protein PPL_00935 [Heterostelium album PN500]EFA85706.1 hypothetical protein PPL_00935 [Heterostelium album PN500]|eukprot:XP_020437812.1 hypothetical protein PPL_00935 [Heterostelium album PN500]